MKKGAVIAIFLLLTGCTYLESDTSYDSQENTTTNTLRFTTTPFDEIDVLLMRVELEAGLNNLLVASSLFNELMDLVEDYEISVEQQARINTMEALLADVLAGEDLEVEISVFSGSDAAAKVMNMIGFTPEGYKFVYHEIPSVVASDSLGYYVFLVPLEVEEIDVSLVKETFFVTDRGEILVLE